ncbi:hypothetical protein ACWDSL_46450 [Streptomyces sp. NPDC000941]
MNTTALSILLSVLSATCYALGAVLQERLAARTAATAHPQTGLLGRGGGLSALGLNALGALVHVAALRYGPLTTVQPLGALTVVLAVPLGAAFARRRAGAREWRGIALALVGLAGMLLATTPSQSPVDRLLNVPQTCLLGGVCLAMVVLLAKSAAGSTGYAIAAGIAFAVGSAFAQSVSVAVMDGGLRALLNTGTALPAALVAPLALAGVLLSQIAYRGGLGAPLVLMTLANPVASCLIGLTLLGERLDGGVPGVVCAVVGATAAARGVVLLCHRGTGEDDRSGHNSIAFPGL